MIAQLLYSFPVDHKTEQGQLFWSGPKRPPQVLNYDPEDPQCLGFVVAAANIYAYSLGLDYCHDIEKIKALSANVVLPKFEIKKISIPEAEDKNKPQEPVLGVGEEDEKAIESLVKKLEGLIFLKLLIKFNNLILKD